MTMSEKSDIVTFNVFFAYLELNQELTNKKFSNKIIENGVSSQKFSFLTSF